MCTKLPFDNPSGMPVDAFIDAGSEPWNVLVAPAERCMARLQHGQMLLIVTTGQKIDIAASQWALNMGHDIAAVSRKGDETRVWIRRL